MKKIKLLLKVLFGELRGIWKWLDGSHPFIEETQERIDFRWGVGVGFSFIFIVQIFIILVFKSYVYLLTCIPTFLLSFFPILLSMYLESISYKVKKVTEEEQYEGTTLVRPSNEN